MRPIGQLKIDNLCKFWKLDIVEDDQWAVNPGHGLVGDPGLGDVVPLEGHHLVYHPLSH